MIDLNLAHKTRHFFMQGVRQKTAQVFFRERGFHIGHLYIKGQMRRDSLMVQLEIMNGQIVSAGGKHFLHGMHQVIPDRIIHSHGICMNDKLNPQPVHCFMFDGVGDGMHIVEREGFRQTDMHGPDIEVITVIVQKHIMHIQHLRML